MWCEFTCYNWCQYARDISKHVCYSHQDAGIPGKNVNIIVIEISEHEAVQLLNGHRAPTRLRVQVVDWTRKTTTVQTYIVVIDLFEIQENLLISDLRVNLVRLNDLADNNL